MQSELTLIEQVKLGKIWDFPGGIHPPERKSLSNQNAIGNFTSHTLYIPVQQHIGEAGKIIVEIGEVVLKGQPLTLSTDGLSLPVHAPTSGTIKAIDQHIDAHPSGRTTLTIVLEADGRDLWVNRVGISDWQTKPPQELTQRLEQLGISGLGGASFPTYVKASPSQNIDLLILNGVECEPYITADDVLMRHHAKEILAGAEILKYLVAAELVVIAIEDNKPEAIAAMQEALIDYPEIELRVVPTKYPSGGEKQLIELITGQQVPSGGIPADIGIVMQNVGTSYAVKRAILDGEALVARVVTVTGERVNNPQNLWVPLGTPIKALLQYVGFAPEKQQRLIMGGPMMGFNIVDDMMPVVKSTNCILAPSEYHLPTRDTEQACIRCGLCADACPAELLPQQLQWFAKAEEHDKLQEYDLFDCIECGACAYVCPSQIPLVQYYRIAKADIRQAEEEKRKAEKAKRRFEERQERLEREKQARLKKHKEAADKRKKALDKDDSAKDKIAAALARAKAKKANTDAAPDKTDEPKDKVAAAIARAKAKKQAAVKEQESSPSTSSIETSNTDTATAETSPDPKDKVAAAIARAKAKKLAKAKEAEAQATDEPSISDEQPVTGDPSEQTRKDKVAAAIARAKAKKAQAAESQPAAETPENDEVKVAAVTQPEPAERQKPESNEQPAEPDIDDRKAKVAAAIAKAKAKKAANNVSADNSDSKSEKTPEQVKKEKVAAAIAKAKAKRQAQSPNKPDGSNKS